MPPEHLEKNLEEVSNLWNLFCRVEELKRLVAKTETEEKRQAEKYVRALKEGEKALEEKTAQLARTRNELQTQMIQFHELNNKINKLKTELIEVQDNVKKGKDEVDKLSQRREEEKRVQELHVKVSWNARVNRVFDYVSNMGSSFFIAYKLLKMRQPHSPPPPSSQVFGGTT